MSTTPTPSANKQLDAVMTHLTTHYIDVLEDLTPGERGQVIIEVVDSFANSEHRAMHAAEDAKATALDVHERALRLVEQMAAADKPLPTINLGPIANEYAPAELSKMIGDVMREALAASDLADAKAAAAAECASTYDDQLAKRDLQIADLFAQLQVAEQQASEFNAQVQAARPSVAAPRLLSKIKMLNKRLDASHATSADLRNQLSLAKENGRRLASANADLMSDDIVETLALRTQQRDQLLAEVSDLRESFTEAHTVASGLRAQLEGATTYARQLETEKAGAQQQVGVLRDKLAAATDKHRTAIATKDGLATQLTAAQAYNRDLLAKLDAATAVDMLNEISYATLANASAEQATKYNQLLETSNEQARSLGAALDAVRDAGDSLTMAKRTAGNIQQYVGPNNPAWKLAAMIGQL